MSGANRGRYVVQLDGPWRLYTHPLDGWTMLGTIQRGMEIGALARSRAGLYAQINAGAVRALDQRKTTSAVAQQGAHADPTNARSRGYLFGVRRNDD